MQSRQYSLCLLLLILLLCGALVTHPEMQLAHLSVCTYYIWKCAFELIRMVDFMWISSHVFYECQFCCRVGVWVRRDKVAKNWGECVNMCECVSKGDWGSIVQLHEQNCFYRFRRTWLSRYFLWVYVCVLYIKNLDVCFFLIFRIIFSELS